MKNTTSLLLPGNRILPSWSFPLLLTLAVLCSPPSCVMAADLAPSGPRLESVTQAGLEPDGMQTGCLSIRSADCFGYSLSSPIRWAMSNQRRMFQVVTVAMCLALWIMMRR
jgi:hypothetical protein